MKSLAAVTFVLSAAIQAPRFVHADEPDVNYYSIATTATLESDGTVCLPVDEGSVDAGFRANVRPGARVVLVAAVPPSKVAYGVVLSPKLPVCGSYGNFAYRVEVSSGTVAQDTPMIVVLDPSLRVESLRGLLTGTLASGQRIVFHACDAGAWTTLSISSERTGHVRYLWFAEVDQQKPGKLPHCREKESPHYGE